VVPGPGLLGDGRGFTGGAAIAVAEQPDNEPEFSLREYFRVLRRRKWVPIVTIVALVAIGAILSALQTRVYSASAIVLIPPDVQAQLNPALSQGTTLQTLSLQLQDEITAAEGDAVTNAVRTTLGHLPSTSITAVPNADALSFTSQDTSAARAAIDANAYAGAYLNQRRKSNAADYLQTSQVIQGQISQFQRREAQLPRSDPSQSGLRAAIVNLQASLANLQASGQLSRAGGQILNRATPPASPSSPDIRRNLLIAALLGLVIGVWLAFIVDGLDDSIESQRDLTSLPDGIRSLGVIPWVTDWRRAQEAYLASVEDPESPSAEAYRTLRTTIDWIAAEEKVRTIAVTSGSAGDGKSSTIANLGIALARAGRRVTLIDCDLRHPRLHEFFKVDNDVGFASVLLGESSLQDAVKSVEGYPDLTVLVAGPHIDNPSELLSLGSARSIIDSCKDELESDFVLVDCPPVLPVADALQVSRLVDGVLIVVSAGRTKKRQLARSLELLREIYAPILGAVLSGVRSRDDESYGYGYGYGYGYSGYVRSGSSQSR
jgi:capsular exopolysaccharide synthesis family protein